MGFRKTSLKMYKVAEPDRKKLQDWSKLEKVDEIVRRIKKSQKV